MNTQKGFTYYRTGAWILVAAGFAHALAAIPDLFISGLFSPVTGKTLPASRGLTINCSAGTRPGNFLHRVCMGSLYRFYDQHRLITGIFRPHPGHIRKK